MSNTAQQLQSDDRSIDPRGEVRVAMMPGRRGVQLIAALLVAGVFIVAAILWTNGRSQAAILRADPEVILGNQGLAKVALSRGERVFRDHCAGCHGRAGRGDPSLGAPNLTDGEHLYGSGLVTEIEEIARHGIRSGDKRGWRLAAMPKYASPQPYKEEPLPALTPRQVEDVTQFLLGFQGHSTDSAALSRGGAVYQDVAGCWDCHGRNAAGDAAIGAPSLIDDVWLYGRGSHDDIRYSIAYGRAGVSPAFQRSLSAAELRNVAVYVASLQPAGSDPGKLP